MAKNDGTKVCKHCKSEIPAGAKICPNCRKKQGGIGKWIVLAIVVIAVGGVAASGGSSESDEGGKQEASSENASVSGSENTKSDENTSEEEEKIEYISVTAQDLVDAMNKNAMKASETYKEKYLKIKGRLGTVDSDGKYISIDSDEIDFVNIQCYIQSDEQKDVIMEKSTGDKITVKGYCTDVGEIMGYSVDIDSVK